MSSPSVVKSVSTKSKNPASTKSKLPKTKASKASKTVKSVKSNESAPVVVESVPVVVESAPVVVESAPVVVESVPVVVESAPVVVESAPVVVESAPSTEQLDAFKHLLQCVLDLQSQLKNLNNEIRTVEKTYKKQIKDLQKSGKCKKTTSNSSVSKKPSGFVKPTHITLELSKFLKVDPDTMLARTTVTKHINDYIKEHKLYDSATKIITPDKKLQTLLKSGDDKLTYFKGNNIQKYMKIHYIKSDVTPVVT